MRSGGEGALRWLWAVEGDGGSEVGRKELGGLMAETCFWLCVRSGGLESMMVYFCLAWRVP